VTSKVSVIVLNWNGYDDTAACLCSLRQIRYENLEVVVVDNGSTDDSASRLRGEFAEVKFIETGKNLGFAGGCNVGIRHAFAEGADFVWLLNNDTTVDSGALQAMADKANSDSRIGAVGSAIYSMDEPELMQSWGGGRVNFWLGRSGHFLEPVPDSKIDFITGASMLMRRQAVDDIGLLDEEFFMYWEDTDYCFRLRQSKWRIAVAGESKIRHKQCSSVGKGSVRQDAYFNASAARFFDRHARLPMLSLWMGVATRIAKRVLMGDWERIRAVWDGARRREVAGSNGRSRPATSLEVNKWRP
jgi:hypothetical protein